MSRGPNSEPVIKLAPIIKLTGNSMVSLKTKLTFFLFELFCIPTINIKNNDVFNKILNNIFL